RVGGHGQPRSHLAVRPLDPDLRVARRAQAEVYEAELPADVAATHRELATGRGLTDTDLDPGADRVAVGTWLAGPDVEPGAHRGRGGGAAGPHIPPEHHLVAVVDLDQVGQPVEVEVGERRTP